VRNEILEITKQFILKQTITLQEKSMARKRIYEGNTEQERTRLRVKAHRQKKKLGAVKKEDVLSKIEKRQNKYDSENKLERIKSKEITCTEILFVCKRKDSNEYVLILRSYDLVVKRTSATMRFNLSIEVALAEFESVTAQNRENYWFSFGESRERASSFIRAYINKNENDFVWGNEFYSFRFLAMLTEVLEMEGTGPYREFKRNITIETMKNRQSARRLLVSYLPDLVFDKKQSKEDMVDKLKSCINHIIIQTLNENNKDVKMSGCRLKIIMFQEILETTLGFLRVYDCIHPEMVRGTFEKSAESILESYKKTRDCELGILDDDNNPYIPPIHLKEILDTAWKTNRSLYYAVALSLSVGGREEEMRRLVQSPNNYILADGTLDYNNTNRRKNIREYLVQKTANNNITDLTNPRLSIVSRMILLHEKPIFAPTKFFIDQKKGFRSKPELQKYHERCLRTTCATMIAFCSRIKGPWRSDHSEVQVRLAHSTIETSLNVYAKKIPKDISPIKYFDINPDIKLMGESITEHSNLWDVWLLRDYLGRKGQCFKNQQDIAIFNSRLLSEARFYNDHMNQNVSEKKEDSTLDWMSFPVAA
jgi:hypothetical protein